MIWSDLSTKRQRKLVASLGIAVVLALVMPWAVLAPSSATPAVPR